MPGSVGLAATFDKDVWRKAGMWQARAWRAMGITCELGPQIDLYTQLRGTRLNGSVGNDPALNRDFAAEFGGGMQSTWGDDEATQDLGWGKDSVGVMLKHFVGEGSNEGGRDDHSDSGKWNVFPGGQFKAHLVPFLDGGMHLNSSTEEMAAVMPCYGIPYDPNDPDGLGEHVGAGFSEYLLSGLRNTGWDGMLTTDWMISSGTGHGVGLLDGAQRLQKMYSAGIDQHGGSFEIENGTTAWNALVAEVGEEEALAQYQDHARHVFKFMNKVQLFDNPYSDRSAAKAILESEGVPRCPQCGGVIKPWVVLYGEAPDKYTLMGATREIAHADALIVAGTSLSVEPAASLLERFSGSELVVINKEPTPADARATLCIHGDVAEIMGELVI